MNVRKLHLPFKLPGPGDARLRPSTRPSKPKPDTPHIHSRVRAYGKARLDIIGRIQTQQDWDALWRPPTHAFPFAFPPDGSWKQCLEYRVDDLALEVGFWIDILGLQVIAFSPDYVQFNSPGGEFTFAVSSTLEGQPSTPPGSFRLQINVQNLEQTVHELERRSVQFDQLPVPQQPGSLLHYATFSTPHGIPIDLAGEIDPIPVPAQIEQDEVLPLYPPPVISGPARQAESSPVDHSASLDLLTWDKEDDPYQDSAFTPVKERTLFPEAPTVPVTPYNNWPVSNDIAAETNQARRSRHFSEESSPYTVEPPAPDLGQAEPEEDVEDWDETAGSQDPAREEEYSETITYEPVD